MLPKFFSKAVDGVTSAAENLRDKVTDEKFLRQVKNSASTTARNLRENVGTAVDTAADVAHNLRGKIVERNFVSTREIPEEEVPPDVREKITRLERTPVLEKIDVNATDRNVGEKIVHDAIKKFNKSFRRS